MKKNLLLLILLIADIKGFGQSWTTLPVQIPESIQSISFSDNDHGFITCSSDKIYKTLDGGFTWFDVSPVFPPSGGSAYKAICALDNLTAFAGRDLNELIRTIDGGITWDIIPLPIAQTNEIGFLNDSIGFAQGTGGIFKTIDRGNTWTLTGSPREGGLFFITDSIVISGGYGNDVFKSIDQGLTWATYNTKMIQGTLGLYFFDAFHGIAVDGDGYWSTTYDGGVTWDTSSHSLHLNQVGIYFVNSGKGFAIYTNLGGSFFTSIDSGLTWINSISGNGGGLTDMCFPTKCVGYICSLSGNILKYTDPPCITGIGSPAMDKESITLFPNPVNDHFIISCENEMLMEFILYDVSSQKLMMQSFTSSEAINTSSLAKGIYLYEIRMKGVVLKNGKLIKM